MLYYYINVNLYKNIIKYLLFVLSVVCIYGGIEGLILGKSDYDYIIDNSYRFFSGMYLGVGLIFFWVGLTIHKHNEIIFLIAFLIFISALGRIISLINFGFYDDKYIFYILIEVFLSIVLIFLNTLSNKIK